MCNVYMEPYPVQKLVLRFWIWKKCDRTGTEEFKNLEEPLHDPPLFFPSNILNLGPYPTIKTSLIGSRNFHQDAYISIKHAHPSCAYIILHMSLTHCFKVKAKFYIKTLYTHSQASTPMGRANIKERHDGRKGRDLSFDSYINWSQRLWSFEYQSKWKNNLWDLDDHVPFQECPQFKTQGGLLVGKGCLPMHLIYHLQYLMCEVAYSQYPPYFMHIQCGCD
jgi:hypothetical protein